MKGQEPVRVTSNKLGSLVIVSTQDLNHLSHKFENTDYFAATMDCILAYSSCYILQDKGYSAKNKTIVPLKLIG